VTYYAEYLKTFFLTKSSSYNQATGYAVLTVLWIGYCHAGPISLCILLWAQWVDLMGLKP